VLLSNQGGKARWIVVLTEFGKKIKHVCSSRVKLGRHVEEVVAHTRYGSVYRYGCHYLTKKRAHKRKP